MNHTIDDIAGRRHSERFSNQSIANLQRRKDAESWLAIITYAAKLVGYTAVVILLTGWAVS